MRRNERAITLIALVITIIVLLILAGISIATLTGENGLLNKTNIAQVENRGAMIEEEKNLWKTNQTADRLIGQSNIQTLEDVLNKLEKDKLITKEERELIENEGEITIGSRTIVFQKIDMIDKIANIVNKHTDDEGNINLEEVKKELESIGNIEGIPSDLTQDKLPLVLKVEDEFVQINSDGSVRFC